MTTGIENPRVGHPVPKVRVPAAQNSTAARRAMVTTAAKGDLSASVWDPGRLGSWHLTRVGRLRLQRGVRIHATGPPPPACATATGQ